MQRRRSCQKVKANFMSSIGCQQHGKRFPRSTLKVSRSLPLYSKKYFTTMPIQALGSMKAGNSAGVWGQESLRGEVHMKPLGKILTLERSFHKTCAKMPSTICLKVRFSARTKEWKAARSKSTSLSHITCLSFIGTKDITRQRSNFPHLASLSGCERLAATGYFTSSGKGFSGCAVSKGSPSRRPNFMSSRAVKQGSVRLAGVSFSKSLSTVAFPSSGEMKSSFSRSMKCTKALKECRSESKVQGPTKLMPRSRGPSFSNS
mmetsp:Transcript_73169/g.161492  ORF Transcript_73169/g.161492 Transcript_73169/m.161492 type:complete len:261 (+) Transcript_73169:192-974(+)